MSFLRKIARDTLNLLRTYPLGQVIPDMNFINVTRRTWTAPALMHARILELLAANEHLRAMEIPFSNYLISVVVTEHEIRANFYPTTKEQLASVYDPEWSRNGKLHYLVTDGKAEPVIRPGNLPHYNPYEPEISFMHVLTDEERSLIESWSNVRMIEVH